MFRTLLTSLTNTLGLAGSSNPNEKITALQKKYMPDLTNQLKHFEESEQYYQGSCAVFKNIINALDALARGRPNKYKPTKFNFCGGELPAYWPPQRPEQAFVLSSNPRVALLQLLESDYFSNDNYNYSHIVTNRGRFMEDNNLLQFKKELCQTLHYQEAQEYLNYGKTIAQGCFNKEELHVFRLLPKEVLLQTIYGIVDNGNKSQFSNIVKGFNAIVTARGLEAKNLLPLPSETGAITANPTGDDNPAKRRRLS